MSQRRVYWIAVAAVLVVLAIVSARIYHPGQLVEFSDTIYPMRPDLTLSHWTSWWSTSIFLGSIWTNTAYLPNMLIPYLAHILRIDPGIGQAFQFFVYLAVPTVAAAFCIASLARDRLTWQAALPLAILPFNIYAALVWTSSVGVFALGSAALFAWSLVEGVERGRWARGLFVGGLAAFWLSPCIVNPPYFLVVVAHTALFGLWLLVRNRTRWRSALRFGSILALVAVLVGARWIVPLVVLYTHYPLTKFATGGVGSYNVMSRAHLVNVLRLTPMWYWGIPDYTYYAGDYITNVALKLGTFAPFLLTLVALMLAVRLRARTLLLLFGLVLFWAFLVKGENVPFVAASTFIYKLPTMSLFRDSEKFVGPLLVDACVAAGVTFSVVTLSRLNTLAITSTSLFAAVAGGWLMLTGEVFNAPRGTPPLYVRIPSSYLSLAENLRDAGIRRALILPADTFYEIGTNWGFFGADTEFFDDLPAASILHAPPLSYTSHAGYDEVWNTYQETTRNDSVARRAFDERLSIDGIIVRRDLIPNFGVESSMWREGELGGEFAPAKGSSTDLGLYATARPAPFVFELPNVLGAGRSNYTRALRSLVSLGLGTPPLVLAERDEHLPRVARISGLGDQDETDALLVDGKQSGSFHAAPGWFEIVARGASHASWKIDVSAPTSLPARRAEIVLGIKSDLVRWESNPDPLGETYQFRTEGAYSASTELVLPVLGPHRATCADVRIDGRRVARLRIEPGRQTLRVPATVPPGIFFVEVAYGAPAPCRASNKADEPLWTESAPPPASLGRAVTDAGKQHEVFRRSYVVNIPLSAYPSVHFALKARRKAPEDLFALAHVHGAGCDAAVSVRDGDSVNNAFDELARRATLSQACRDAAPTSLFVETIDVVAVAPHGAMASSFAITIDPARPEVDAPSPSATLMLDGHRIEVPRDDIPHTYRLRLLGDHHNLSTSASFERVGIFRAGLIQKPKALPGDFSGVDTWIAKPGWIVYSQAHDSLWHATLNGSHLPQRVADLDLQAYYAGAPGRLRIWMPMLSWRWPAESVTWLTLCVVTILGVLRWREQ